MSIRRPAACLVALGLLMTACSSAATPPPAATATSAPSVASVAPSASATASPTASPSPSPTPRPTPSPTPTPTPVPTPTTFTLNQSVWFSGFAITITGGDYDALKHKLDIDGTFQNMSTQQIDLTSLNASVKIVWNGQFLPGYLTEGPVPVGATASGQIQVQPPAGFTVADAVVAFGQPSEHQALVPLGGSQATYDQPTTLGIAGTVKMGKYVTFTITRSMLVPSACTGYPDRIRYGPLPKDQISIVLWGVATNSEGTGYAQIDQGYVTVPDGTTAISNPAVSLSLAPKQTLRDQGMCFAVPAPGSGSYKLTMHESRSKGTGSITIQLP